MKSRFFLVGAFLFGCPEPDLFVDEDVDGFTVEFDCDDNDPNTHPGADEQCDGLDNDCDGSVDEDVPGAGEFYPDADGDGFGDAGAEPQYSCMDPEDGSVTDNTDCNDGDSQISPGEPEVCDPDGIDENCNGLSNDGDPGVDQNTQSDWYIDVDMDGYGDQNLDPFWRCENPSNEANAYVRDGQDCDDTNRRVHPDAQEVCDGLDNDCNPGSLEDGLVAFRSSSDGTLTDVDFSGSSFESPNHWDLTGVDRVNMCVGIHYATVSTSEDVDFFGFGATPEGVILSGGNSGRTVLLVEEDSGGDFSEVNLTNFSIRNGEGDTLYWSEPLAGGGIGCLGTESELSLNNMLVTDNVAHVGAGIFSYGCDVQILDSEIFNNEATSEASFSGCSGAFLIGADVLIERSSIYRNTGASYSGMCVVSFDEEVSVKMDQVDIYDNEVTSDEEAVGSVTLFNQSEWDFEVDLHDTRVYDNILGVSSINGMAGLSVVNYTSFVWSGSSEGASATTGNDQGGLYLIDSLNGLAELSEVDFGEPGTVEENSNWDVYITNFDDNSFFRVGDSGEFVCKNYLCGPNTDSDEDPENDVELKELGSTSKAAANADSDRLTGTVFKGSNFGTLKTFGRYFRSGGSLCTVNYFVLGAMDTDSDGLLSSEVWEVLWADAPTSLLGTTLGWHESSHIGEFFPPTKEDALGVTRDMYYAPVLAWECETDAAGSAATVKYYLDEIAPSADDMGLGQTWGVIYNSTFVANSLSVGDLADVTTFRDTKSEQPVYLTRMRTLHLE